MDPSAPEVETTAEDEVRDEAQEQEDVALLQQEVKLPCGRVVPNRIVKAAMYESLTKWLGGPPNPKHFRMYKKWAEGGWGMILTGNVMVDPEHLTLGRDMVVPKEITPEAIANFTQLSEAMTPSSPAKLPLRIMQLSHSGRQAGRIMGGRPYFGRAIAPSAVPVRSKDGKDGVFSKILYSWMFPTPKEASEEDLEWIMDAFVRGAKLAAGAGMDGVQVHCGHGYLLSQFLSPICNLRTDKYGFPNELNIVKDIITRIRAATPKDFVVGVKINSADYVSGRLPETVALEHIKNMAEWGMIDFIEISGGDYERSDFSDTAKPRQAFFEKFARLAVEAMPEREDNPVVMLTGSFRARSLMAKAIRAGHTHLIGVGRPSCIYPEYAKAVFNPNTTFVTTARSGPYDVYIPDAPNPLWLRLLHTGLLGAGVNTAYHCSLIWRMSAGYWDGMSVPSHSIAAEELMQEQIPDIGGIQSIIDIWRPK